MIPRPIEGQIFMAPDGSYYRVPREDIAVSEEPRGPRAGFVFACLGGILILVLAYGSAVN